MSLNQLLYGEPVNRPWMNIKVNSIDFGDGNQLSYYNTGAAVLNFDSGSLSLLLTAIGEVVVVNINGSFVASGGAEKSSNAIPLAFRPVGNASVFAVPSFVGSTGRLLYCVIGEDGTFEFTNTEGSNTIAANTYDIANSCISYQLALP